MHPIVFVVFVFVLILAASTATQIAASQLRYNPSLGRPLFFHVYAPWMILSWTCTFFNPLSRAVYPPMVYSAITDSLKFFSFGIAAAVAAAFVTAATVRSKSQENNQLFDTTKWASTDEAETLGLFAPAGPIVGGMKMALGKIRPIRYSGDKNIMMIEQPGAGKSSVLTTNLLMSLQHADAHKWTEIQRRLHPHGEEANIFVPDVKGELWLKTAGYQQDVLKKDVYLLAPLGNIEDGNGKRLPSDGYASYNPFWSIRLGTDLGFQDCYSIVQNIIDDGGEGVKTHWDRTSIEFGAAVIEKLGFLALNRGQWEQFSLPGLAAFVRSMLTVKPKTEEAEKLKQGEDALNRMLTFLKETPDDPTGVFGWTRYDFENDKTIPTNVKPSIYDAASAMERKEIRERASVYSSFIAYLSLYLGESFKKYATTSSFSWTNIANNDARASAIYFGVNPLDIPKVRPYIRLVLTDALEQLTRGGNANIGGRPARKAFRPFWFALDEVAAFRKLTEIEVGSGFFRSYGVYLFLIFQSLAQLVSNYGTNEVISETTGMMLFGRPARAKAAEEISNELGQLTVTVQKRTKSTSSGSSIGNTSTQETSEAYKVPLLTAKQIMQIEDDKLIATSKGHNFYLTKFPFHKNASLRKRAQRKPPKKPASKIVMEPAFIREVRLELGDEKWDALSSHIIANSKTRMSKT